MLTPFTPPSNRLASLPRPTRPGDDRRRLHVQKAARLVLVALTALLAVPAAGVQAATRMPIGFFDDSSFRFSTARQQNLAGAAAAGASVIHTTANWSALAPTRPSTPSNGDDPAYRLPGAGTLPCP